MFLNHFKNFYPGVGRDRLIEVAAHFRIVASLGYLLVNSSVKRNQESLLRSRQIAEARFEVGGPGNVLCPECANREPMSTPKIEGSSGLMLDAGDGGKSELYKQMKKDPDNGEWVLFVEVQVLQ